MSFTPIDYGNGLLRPAAFPGRMVRAAHNRVRTQGRLDSVGLTPQILRVTVAASPAADTLFSIKLRVGTVVNVDVTYTTDGSTSATELRDGLAAALLASGVAMSVIKSVVDVSTDAFDITFQPLLAAATISFPNNTGTKLSQSNTAAVAAPQYYFGRACEIVAQGSVHLPPGAVSEFVRPCATVASGTGPLVAYTLTHAATGRYNAEIEINGAGRVSTWTSGADLAAAVAAGIIALAATFPEATVTSPGAGVINVQFAAGNAIVMGAFSATPTGATIVGVYTAGVGVLGSGAYQLTLVIDDLSTPTFDLIGNIVAPVGPLIGSVVECADFSGGVSWCVDAPAATVTQGEAVWVECAADANKGKLHTLASKTSTSRLWLDAPGFPAPRWERIDAGNPDFAHISF